MTHHVRGRAIAAGRRLGRQIGSSLAMVLALSATGAFAQQAPAADGDQPKNSGDIVVTATRGGNQRLQTIPMAVSAISAEGLSRGGVSDVASIVKSVPSVNVVERGPGQSQITIRGISSGAFSITETGDRPLVSVYLDDVPISVQGANPDLKIFDLQRVEVLRGPQGTLYGSGAMAGTIRYITVKPDVSKFSGSVEGDLSATTHAKDPSWNLRGSLNIPLGQNLAFLGAAYTGRDAGWINNLGTGQNGANSTQTTQTRGALRYSGANNLIVDASVIYARSQVNGLPVGYTGLTRYQYDSLAPEFFHDNMIVGNLSTDLALGGGHFTTSTSYNSRHFTSQTGGFNYEYLNQGALGLGSPIPSPGDVDQHVYTFTEEVRFVSRTDLPFSYSLGGFYEKTTRGYVQNNVLNAYGAFPGLDSYVGLPSIPSFGTPFANDLFYGTQHISERQFALFGELNYKLTKQIDFTAGLRYFDFSQTFNLAFTGLAGSAFIPTTSGTPVFQPLTQTGNPRAKGVNPRFVLTYHADKDVMVFAEASRGFRYGSVNEPVAPAFCAGLNGPNTVGSDHVWNYALGLKSQTADRALTFNVTGFYVDWRDVQTRVDLSCGYYYRVNAGHVVSKGLELETTLRPARGLSFTLNGSYTDSSARQTVTVTGADPIVEAGDRTPLFPSWIASLNGTYQTDIGSGKLILSGDVQYRSDLTNRFSPLNANFRTTPEQTLLNASVNYDLGGYEVGVFGTNLTNNQNISLIDSVRGKAAVKPYGAIFYGHPRVFGARIKAKF